MASIQWSGATALMMFARWQTRKRGLVHTGNTGRTVLGRRGISANDMIFCEGRR